MLLTFCYVSFKKLNAYIPKHTNYQAKHMTVLAVLVIISIWLTRIQYSIVECTLYMHL
jgi:hypothetical protein